MSDWTALGGSAVWQSDALEDFSGSAESGITVVLEGKPYVIPEEHTEAIARRLRIVGRVRSTARFLVYPIVDGVRRLEGAGYVTVTASSPGTWERFEKLLDLYIPDAVFTDVKRGIRGSEFAIYVSATDPSSEFHLEAATIVLRSLGSRRRRKAE